MVDLPRTSFADRAVIYQRQFGVADMAVAIGAVIGKPEVFGVVAHEIRAGMRDREECGKLSAQARHGSFGKSSNASTPNWLKRTACSTITQLRGDDGLTRSNQKVAVDGTSKISLRPVTACAS